jgi:hypothetical protein
VRDLAWVIQSPVLLNPSCKDFQWPPDVQPDGESLSRNLVIDDDWLEQQLQQCGEWLSELDTNPKRLQDWLTARFNPRLGYYFESLVEFWLRHTNAGRRIVPHLQVKERQHTVGEFDFLLDNGGNHCAYHWEVAVKFYLYFRHADERILWYGPNSRDRLDIKLQRLFHHQLRLSAHPAAADRLRQSGVRLPVVPQLLLKGYLFYPSHGDWRNPPLRDELSAHHLRGWWTYMERFDIPNAEQDRRWVFLPRLQWLAPAVSDESDASLMNIKQLHSFCLDLLTRKQRPPLIAEMRFTDAGVWEEVSRGFVLPETWPSLGPKQ